MSIPVWQRIRPGLEAKASSARDTRLTRERTSLLLQRRKTVKSLYDAYKTTLLPSQWAYLPRALEICNFACFKALIEADADEAIGPEEFAGCMDLLPELLVGRLEALRTALQASMGGAHNASTSATPLGHPAPGVDLLDLATAAFHCQRHTGTPSTQLVIGWSAIASHRCEDEEEGMGMMALWPKPSFTGMADDVGADTQKGRFVFKAEAAVVAEDLVRCAGLDEHALAAEMDVKGLRFGCKLCFNTRGSRLHGSVTVGLGWRDAVSNIRIDGRTK